MRFACFRQAICKENSPFLSSLTCRSNFNLNITDIIHAEPEVDLIGSTVLLYVQYWCTGEVDFAGTAAGELLLYIPTLPTQYFDT